MKPLKALFSLLPGGRKLADSYSRRKRTRYFARLGDSEQIFTHYYQVNKWKDSESVSGVGSTLQNTRAIRRELPGFLESYSVDTILDAPCGDYNWFQEIVGHGSLNYIGGDIVKPLVEKNQANHGDRSIRFVHLDIVRDALPAADLWFCRDCLIHLSLDDIRSAIRNFLASEIGYLLTTVHSECVENEEIRTGEFRLLNLELPPFSFPKPALTLDDSADGLPKRAMALWSREELESALSQNEYFSAGASVNP